MQPATVATRIFHASPNELVPVQAAPVAVTGAPVDQFEVGMWG